MKAHALRKPPIQTTPGGLLARMRVRKKLIVLHTAFSLVLAGTLLLALRPAIERVIAQAEMGTAEALALAAAGGLRAEAANLPGAVEIRGSAEGLPSNLTARALERPGEPFAEATAHEGALAIVALPDGSGRLAVARTVSVPVRRAAAGVYLLILLAVLVAYGLIAAALEFFILPRNVYGPIQRLLEADRAVQRGDEEHELVREDLIPADELGEIMRSRNASVLALRRNEKALAEALDRLETVANDLKRKNHLLETARQNLADADRLASLGMMSAGIAHELNTPLAVVKGLVEKIQPDRPGGGLSHSELALLSRVVGRLERLSESLLDFARARRPSLRRAPVAPIVDEAITLVRLDRDAGEIGLENRVPPDLEITCDPDRMVQVFVNLIRNAVDALRGAPAPRTPLRITVDAATTRKEDVDWASITVWDNGPGIDPDVLPRLFEPFVSTRLDARGTGLGLAVAEGIVREHRGTLLARNRPRREGAEFEVMMPVEPLGAEPREPRGSEGADARPAAAEEARA